jgi:hypothetical protein
MRRWWWLLLLGGGLAYLALHDGHTRERRLTEELAGILTGDPYALEILAGGQYAALVRAHTVIAADHRDTLASWITRARGAAPLEGRQIDRLREMAPRFLHLRGHGRAWARGSGDTVRVFLPVTVAEPDSVDRDTRLFLAGKSWWNQWQSLPNTPAYRGPHIASDSLVAAYAAMVDHWSTLPVRADTLVVLFDRHGAFLDLTTGGEARALARRLAWRTTSLRNAPRALTAEGIDSVWLFSSNASVYARPAATGWWDPEAEQVPTVNYGIRCRMTTSSVFTGQLVFAYRNDPLGPASFPCDIAPYLQRVPLSAVTKFEVQYQVIIGKDSAFGDYVSVPLSKLRGQP